MVVIHCNLVRQRDVVLKFILNNSSYFEIVAFFEISASFRHCPPILKIHPKLQMKQNYIF